MASGKVDSEKPQPPPLEPPDFDEHYSMGNTWIAIEPPGGGREQGSGERTDRTHHSFYQQYFSNVPCQVLWVRSARTTHHRSSRPNSTLS